MGYNRRKMEAEQKAKADAKVAVRRATDAQVLEDAERLIAAWNERQANRMPMLFAPTDRRRDRRTPLVPVGALPGLPHDAGDRLARSRSPPRRGCDQSHPCAFVSLVPAERSLRRARASVTNQHR